MNENNTQSRKKNLLGQGLVALIVGALFGFGLTVSGMTQPQKVVGFLDIFGNWDPSLAFVMLGAIGVHVLAYRLQKKRVSPFLADAFSLPKNKKIDSKLLIGSSIFGIGWGLGGYCPGPALASLVSLKSEIFWFVAAMAVGMFVQEYMQKYLEAIR